MTEYFVELDNFSGEMVNQRLNSDNVLSLSNTHRQTLLTAIDKLISMTVEWTLGAERDVAPTINVSVRGPKTKKQKANWRKVRIQQEKPLPKQWRTEEVKETTQKIKVVDSDNSSSISVESPSKVIEQTIAEETTIKATAHIEDVSSDGSKLKFSKITTEEMVIDIASLVSNLDLEEKIVKQQAIMRNEREILRNENESTSRFISMISDESTPKVVDEYKIRQEEGEKFNKMLKVMQAEYEALKSQDQMKELIIKKSYKELAALQTKMNEMESKYSSTQIIGIKLKTHIYSSVIPLVEDCLEYLQGTIKIEQLREKLNLLKKSLLLCREYNNM